MAFSKAAEFPETDFFIAQLCKVLSHPARITILRKLMHEEKMSVYRLSENIPLAQPTISNHLKQLRGQQLVDARQEGTNIYYSLNKENEDMIIGIFSIVHLG